MNFIRIRYDEESGSFKVLDERPGLFNNGDVYLIAVLKPHELELHVDANSEFFEQAVVKAAQA